MEYTDIQNAIRSFSLSALASRYAAPAGTSIISGVSQPGKPIYADAAKQPISPQEFQKRELAKQQKGLDDFIKELAAEKQMEIDGVTPDKEAGRVATESADSNGFMSALSTFFGSK